MIKVLFIGAVNPLSEVENRYNPLWPAYLASYVKKNFSDDECEFRYISSNIENEIILFGPNIIGISSVTQNYHYAKNIAKIAKKFNLPVIIGGIHITALPQSLTEDMDIGCIGEGEITFLDIIKHFVNYGCINPNHLSVIDGIVFRSEDKLVQTKSAKHIDLIDNIPHPDRTLIGYHYREYLCTSRGCPYNCIFCSCTRHWGGKIRYASPEYVIEEIRELVYNGAKIIRFNDDTFTADSNRLKKIADLIVENGFHKKVKFSCWGRANNIDPEIVKNLKRMNIVSVVMGLESGSERVLKYLKGNVKLEDNIRAVNLLKDSGIQANADFLIGAPDESSEEIMQTYNFIKKSRIDFVTMNIITPLPGTPLWEYALKRKLVTEDMDMRRLNFKFNSNPQTAVVLSEKLDYFQLSEIYNKFKFLVFIKGLKALPGSPWLSEIPRVIFKRIYGKLNIKKFLP